MFCSNSIPSWSQLLLLHLSTLHIFHSHLNDVIIWKHFPRYWPFVRGIHRSPVDSPHKDHWRGALIFSSICAWINGWVYNREAGDLKRHHTHYDVTVMLFSFSSAVPQHCFRQCQNENYVTCQFVLIHMSLSIFKSKYGCFVNPISVVKRDGYNRNLYFSLIH